jgi:hypothetical protein
MKVSIAASLGLLALGGCRVNGVGTGAAGAPTPVATAQASLYRSPPAASAANLTSGGRIHLVGRAEPSARVRLASPTGEAVYVVAGSDGVWRLDLAAQPTPRLFGLAMVDGGRAIQSEGYLAVTPAGAAVQLRAGAGAQMVGDTVAGPAIEALDYDSKGGAVVSGRATAHGAVDVWVDGVRRAHGQAGADGVYSIALAGPLDFGDHVFEIVDGARRAGTKARLSPAASLASGPYRGERTPQGWRIDWITPGGGLQTTLLLNQTETRA